MQSTLCRGCRRPLLDENSGRNIFDDDSVIKSFDSDGSYNKKWCMKLSAGIELITGQKVTKEEKLPHKLCEVCFQNVEAYINFRFQLLKSKDVFLCSVYEDAKVEANKSIEAENLMLLNTPISKVGINDVLQKTPENILFQSEFFASPLLPKTVVNNSLPKTMSEENLINVDDDSTSLDVNEDETNDSINCRLQNDQENNNLDDSDNSADNAVVTHLEATDIKPLDHDIESEIDVCSGEDDDVLELDVQKIKNETVEIHSSSESDIEVCDYEPTGKRGNYNTLSPPIRY
ncbi:uncharacterized protein LOC100117019 [Nasonia vitripennis]|uniref:ZAD domain-containing protein n=1 Tax=Nasonia vitripennis TaxID=7425 RepID=A0A7M7G231_NASVI|nr:uncharacterized protein LOC100117019 [Nasonia vitripennis]